MTPHGDRQEVITYTVKDRKGMIRGRGMTEDAARATIDRMLADDIITASGAPFDLERVTHVSFTHREVVETFGASE